MFSGATQALLHRLRERDHERVGSFGRTMLLLHGEVWPLSIVLFHGLSASPTHLSGSHTSCTVTVIT